MFAAAAAPTPSDEQAGAEGGRVRRADPARRDGPFRALEPIDLPIEDVVEDDAAGVERGGREEQPREGGTVAEAGNGEAGEHIGERRRHVGRAQQLKTGAKHRGGQ